MNNPMSTNRFHKILIFIQMVISIIIILWLNQGIFSFVNNILPFYIKWGLFFLWFGLAFMLNHKYYKLFFAQSWLLLLFFSFLIFITLYSDKEMRPYLQSISYIIMIYSIFLYYFNEQYSKFIKILSLILGIDYLFIGINTYIHLQINPLLSRYLSQGGEAQEKLLGSENYLGIGDYTYFYSLVPILLLIFFWFMSDRKKSIIYLIVFFLGIILLIQGSFAISILFVIIFISLLIIYKYKEKYNFIVLIPFLLIVLVLLLQPTIGTMFNKLADIKELPREVSVKFDEIGNFMNTNNLSGTDMNSRINIYLQSIDAFANNIIIGSKLSGDNKYRSGEHSAWFDLLANFGLLSIPFFIFLYSVFRYTKRRIKKNYIAFYNVYWLYYIILGFINTLFYSSIFTTWFLFLPFAINSSLLLKKRNDSNTINIQGDKN